MQECKFMGQNYSYTGIELDQLQRMLEFRAPTTQEEVRIYLGLVTYLERFIQDIGTKTEPFRVLIKRDLKFG